MMKQDYNKLIMVLISVIIVIKKFLTTNYKKYHLIFFTVQVFKNAMRKIGNQVKTHVIFVIIIC